MATDTSPTRLIDYAHVAASIEAGTKVEVTAPDNLEPIRLNVSDSRGSTVLFWIDLDQVFPIVDALLAGRRERLIKNEALKEAQAVEAAYMPDEGPGSPGHLTEVPF